MLIPKGCLTLKEARRRVPATRVAEFIDAIKSGYIEALTRDRRTGERLRVTDVEGFLFAQQNDGLFGLGFGDIGRGDVQPDDPLFVEQDALARWIADGAIAGSGLPGRPSETKGLIDQEFERRIAAGEIDFQAGLGVAADSLAKWVRAQPGITNPGTTKTIENNIRARFNEAKASQPPK